jgi:hypothetical protein
VHPGYRAKLRLLPRRAVENACARSLVRSSAALCNRELVPPLNVHAVALD